MLIAVLFLAAACGGGGRDPAALHGVPGTTLRQLITDRNEPAVVLIRMVYNATTSVPTPGVNQAAVEALDSQLAAEALSGQIGTDRNSINDAMVAAIGASPGTYFTVNQPVASQPATAGGTCTGSIVTPDGYIVTATQCLTTSPSDLQQQYLQEEVTPIVNGMVQQFMAVNRLGFDSEEQQGLAAAMTKYLTTQAQFSNQTEAIDVEMFPDSSSGHPQSVWEPLSLVTQGKAPVAGNQSLADADDVSILKLDGYGDLPTLPVGSDPGLDTGGPLLIDSYPGAAGAPNDLQHFTPPTARTDRLSAKKTSDLGVPLLEITGPLSQGSSGSPGFNQKGAMVGVVSYSRIDDDNVSSGFLIDGSVVEKLLHEKHIRPRQSLTTTVYDTALNDYYRHYDERALSEFLQVKGLDPSHPYVDAFITKTETAISRGQDRTPALSTTETLILIVASIVLAAIGGGGVTLLLIRRRSTRRTPASASSESPSRADDHPGRLGRCSIRAGSFGSLSAPRRGRRSGEAKP